MCWALAISVLLLGYAYGGYPAVIWLFARFGGRPVEKGRFDGGVSVLIAAHNEAGPLPQKLGNLLELAKTEPIREIWIGLDGCTDGTGEAVRESIQNSEFRIQHREISSHQPATSNLQPSIHILDFQRQRGKAAVLNDLMAKADQPVFLMMDARQRVEAGAISKLLDHFADERVGVVSGALVYESAVGGAQKGAESYWGYEKFIRECESRYWAVPGATGALYAIRKELCAPIPENTLVDDVLIPMRAVLKGFRCLFEPSARVFDIPTAHFGQEGLRKRRTLAGIWQIGRLEPKIYSIFCNPILFQWISHKFLRLLTPVFFVLAYFSLGWMAWEGPRWLRVLFSGALAVLFASWMAFWSGKRISSRLFGLLGAFWGVNGSLVLAALDAWTGRFEARWKQGSPTERPG